MDRCWAANDELTRPCELRAAWTTYPRPSVLARMFWMLCVRAGDRMLDIGPGSGWSTVIGSNLVVPKGSVTGLEIVSELVSMSRDMLSSAGVTNATIEQTTVSEPGWACGAPYDRILLTAVVPRVPRLLLDQLGPKGAIAYVHRGHMQRLRRHNEYERMQQASGHYRFAPMVE